MTQTYTIKLDSCESKPDIKVEFNHVPENRLNTAMNRATAAFRSVLVTAEETGEIILNYYKDARWDTPFFNYGEMIDQLCYICYGKESQD